MVLPGADTGIRLKITSILKNNGLNLLWETLSMQRFPKEPSVSKYKKLCQVSLRFCFFVIIKYAITQITDDNSEPSGAASPIGNKLFGYLCEVSQETGIRISTIDKELCRKETPDFPRAQKYPEKQKCIPASAQSQT